MTTATNSAPIKRIGLGINSDDERQIKRLKTRLAPKLDGKITTMRLIRYALSKLDSSTS